MSRNLKIIIIMLAGILLLSAALIALSCEDCGDDGLLQVSGSDAASSSDSHADSELEGAHLEYNESGERLVDGDELESLRLISSEGDYFIYRKDDGELTIDGLDKLRLETDFLETPWYNAHYFGYSYRIHYAEGAVKLSDFGLDPVQLTIECTYSDGSFCRVFVGNEVTGSPNIYYFMLEGVEGVFLNEFDASFFQGDSYWVDEDIFGDDVDDVTIGTIRLTGSAFEQETVIEPHQSGDKSDPYYGSNYIFAKPFVCRADAYMMALLVDELTELVADDAVCAFPSDGEIAQYGLDQPYAVITHQRNGQQHVLRLAKYNATTLYAMADGVDCIFMLSADTFEVLAALSPELLRAPEVHVRYFDAIESIRIQSGDSDYLFRVERTPLETDSTLFEYRAYCGDSQLTLSYYKNLLEIFNSATSVSYGGQRQSDEPALTVTITYYDSFDCSSEVIRYYPAGTRRYLVDMNGDTGIIVGQMWLDKLLNGAELLSKNEAVTP